MTEPKIIGYGRTKAEQNLLDLYLLSFISREEYEIRLATMRGRETKMRLREEIHDMESRSQRQS